MATKAKWDPGMVYFRTVTGDTASAITEHHCWNRERFLAARREEVNKLNSEKGNREISHIEVCTAEQYRKECKHETR